MRERRKRRRKSTERPPRRAFVSLPRMSDPTHRRIAEQFGAQARNYAMSRTHNDGYTRLLLLEHLQPIADEIALDVACGAGGTTLALAPYVQRVIGLDLAPEMLAATRLAARRAEAAHVQLVRGDVHALPFPDRSLDLAVARAAPHHFADPARAIREMARVLKRGGRLGIADGTVPDDAELDAFVNALDVLHDPTTVRNYSEHEWRGFVEGAGLRVDRVVAEAWDLAEGRTLNEWMSRSGASSERIAAARARLLEAPKRVRDYLRVKAEDDDVRFDLPKIVLVATRPD